MEEHIEFGSYFLCFVVVLKSIMFIFISFNTNIYIIRVNNQLFYRFIKKLLYLNVCSIKYENILKYCETIFNYIQLYSIHYFNQNNVYCFSYFNEKYLTNYIFYMF